jgi:tRNA threonylcarbamoyladenosine biosynthesis protein TsaB
MALILSLETSTSICSVALHENEKLIALSELHIEQSHASQLSVLIDQVVKSAGVDIQKLSAVAVSSGPGSYTGLRIGTSTAKGLCYALNIPLLSIGSLEILSLQLSRYNIDNYWLCPMIDARRMEVYCLLSDADNNIVQPVQAKVIDHTSFSDILDKQKILFFGNGADKCEEMITSANAKFIRNIYPSASTVGSSVYKKYQLSQFEDLTHFEPLYLKEFMIKAPKAINADI